MGISTVKYACMSEISNAYLQTNKKTTSLKTHKGQIWTAGLDHIGKVGGIICADLVGQGGANNKGSKWYVTHFAILSCYSNGCCCILNISLPLKFKYVLNLNSFSF